MILNLIFILIVSSFGFADVYRYTPNKIQLLEPVSGEGISTPDYLLMEPNIYGFRGPSHDCQEEGLYRHFVVPERHTQRIVYNGNVERLMHSISWIHVHGYKDDIKNFKNLMTIAKTRNIYLTCGSISLFTCNLLNTLNIPNRFILYLTLEPWNSYSNGHSCVEIYSNGKWKLWDIDGRACPKAKGIHLDALEFKNAVKLNEYDLFVFSQSPKFALGDLHANGYDLEFFYMCQLLDEMQVRAFYKRSCQVLLIKQGDKFYFTCDPMHRARIESYDHSHTYLPEHEFLDTFYP